MHYLNASNFSVDYGQHVCIAFSYWGCYEIIVKMTMVMTRGEENSVRGMLMATGSISRYFICAT